MYLVSHNPERRRGISVVWLALSLFAIIGVVAIGLDGGQLLSTRIHCQATADAAALAAAGQLYASYPANGGLDKGGTALAAALQVAAANGVTPGTNGASVTVNIPPLAGDFIGQRGYAEVIVQQGVPASFSAIFGYSDLTVSARAVARGVMVQGAGKGFYVLRSNGGSVFHAGRNTVLTIVNASLYVNSTSDRAVNIGNSSTITASSFEFFGSYNDPVGLNGPIHHPAAPALDPLAALPPPNFASYPVQSDRTLRISTTVSLAPGVYVGGIVLNSGAEVTLQPGIYILNDGGLDVGRGAQLQGTGVMIYNGAPDRGNPGNITMDDQSTVRLNPPESGTYIGISIFQDRASDKKITIAAQHNKQITGAIYAAAAEVKLVGSDNTDGTIDILAGAVVCLTAVVEGRFEVSGAGTAGPAKSLYGLVD